MSQPHALDAERSAFLAAILNQPADDVARLVFADWLEEKGQEEGDRERAEFIRLQIEIEQEIGPDSVISRATYRKADNILERVRKGAPVRLKANTLATKLARASLLLTPVGSNHPRTTWFMDTDKELSLWGPQWRRGFVEEICCHSLAARLMNMIEVLRRHPVTKIVLPSFMMEIDSPTETDSTWQAYFYPRHSGEATDSDYFDMNAWDSREEMIKGVVASVRSLVRSSFSTDGGDNGGEAI